MIIIVFPITSFQQPSQISSKLQCKTDKPTGLFRLDAQPSRLHLSACAASRAPAPIHIYLWPGRHSQRSAFTSSRAKVKGQRASSRSHNCIHKFSPIRAQARTWRCPVVLCSKGRLSWRYCCDDVFRLLTFQCHSKAFPCSCFGAADKSPKSHIKVGHVAENNVLFLVFQWFLEGKTLKPKFKLSYSVGLPHLYARLLQLLTKKACECWQFWPLSMYLLTATARRDRKCRNQSASGCATSVWRAWRSFAKRRTIVSMVRLLAKFHAKGQKAKSPHTHTQKSKV